MRFAECCIWMESNARGILADRITFGVALFLEGKWRTKEAV